ncbi:S-adenosyl-L-methionine-dependent methyltransferase [Cucurbitaria berberidis CBS 394.84]|uniref:DNA (cytosine-5-)-methyltransferase n=1 Tax=Cucurbitaria berberidis CBS 394.84 TaxID=1168544 RepID=A0A9P4LB84_9PLEO|nr:S-adenosyl-L-methionine-dependent methyltransferase [Cucurbitaria berberidis CBS 394.84]KAF1848243.1 S-adenosyl-L-methionine-dependent methyltransferase [Cucurbitaria berberidis CBS 394.84]
MGRPRSQEASSQTNRVQVNHSQDDFPRSHITNSSPRLPVTPETEALRSLIAESKRHPAKLTTYDGYQSKQKLLYLDLCDFEIYRSPDSGCPGREFELTSLLHLEAPKARKLWFDGFLCIGETKLYVERVALQDSSIEGFGDDDEPGVLAYVRSTLASKDSTYEIWYKLGEPAQQYKRFHEPFLWAAQLTKHTIDYIETHPARSVGLENFRKDFHCWLAARFARSSSEDFRQWRQSLKSQADFRVAVNANINFIYHHASGLNSQRLLDHPLWSECMAGGLTSMKPQVQLVENTLATPHVYDSFKAMYFGENLKQGQASEPVKRKQELRISELGFGRVCSGSSSTPLQLAQLCQPYGRSAIRVGDIVGLDSTELDRQVWKNADLEWLAYVQGVIPLHNGTQRLSVIWIYRPQDTNIFKAKYPFENELFFSDHCNHESAGELLSTHVKGKYSVKFSPTIINSTKRLFIRQTYITENSESAFVTFHEDHKTCKCKRDKTLPIVTFRPGDTVYMSRTIQQCEILEPTIIQRIDRSSSKVTVRKLLRLKRDCSELASRVNRTNMTSNELVLTDEVEEVNVLRIKRRCSIRFVPKQDVLNCEIPFPYNREGAGHFWFLSMKVTTVSSSQQLAFLKEQPSCLHGGSDWTTTNHSLRGLSIFSGGGSLDRGLEECGAVEFKTAVDLSATAMHTQRANARDPSTMRLYCGSVDDHFKAALEGNKPYLIVRIGEVDLIVGGTPCPGTYNPYVLTCFSLLQQNFKSPQSKRNASHITTFCSYVDLYRPLYGILENVVSMTATRKGHEDENVLSQVVACLVSMGYQVNQYIMDAWSYGSAQQRSRFLLTIAAPGMNPIIQPWHTHSAPEDTLSRSLGVLPNGQRFGERKQYPTPFPYISAGEVTSDLPSIGNGIVQSCSSHPDHRLSCPPNIQHRALLKYIPKYPPGSGYKKAYELGLIPSSLQRIDKETGKAYTRVKEAGLIPTITTNVSVQDSRNGACVHWLEDRPISILEARRAQGYPDHEPIIGNLAQQYVIVGNGVDRKVSFVLGLALLQALEKSASSGHLIKPTKLVEKTIASSSEEEDQAEIDATSPTIRVQVPTLAREEQAKTRPRSSLEISALPRPGVNLPRSSKADQAAPLRKDEMDGPSDVAPPTLELSQPISPLPLTKGTISSLSLALLRSAGGFLSSALPLSKPVTVSKHTKRSRGGAEDDMTEVNDKRSTSGEQSSSPRKRTMLSQPRTAATSGMESGNTSRATTHDSTKISMKRRHTRHSGLIVEFVPEDWSKRVERKRKQKR